MYKLLPNNYNNDKHYNSTQSPPQSTKQTLQPLHANQSNVDHGTCLTAKMRIVHFCVSETKSKLNRIPTELLSVPIRNHCHAISILHLESNLEPHLLPLLSCQYSSPSLVLFPKGSLRKLSRTTLPLITTYHRL